MNFVVWELTLTIKISSGEITNPFQVVFVSNICKNWCIVEKTDYYQFKIVFSHGGVIWEESFDKNELENRRHKLLHELKMERLK